MIKTNPRILKIPGFWKSWDAKNSWDDFEEGEKSPASLSHPCDYRSVLAQSLTFPTPHGKHEIMLLVMMMMKMMVVATM